MIGAGVLIAGGNGPAPAVSRLQATQSSVAPLLEPAPVEIAGVERLAGVPVEEAAGVNPGPDALVAAAAAGGAGAAAAAPDVAGDVASTPSVSMPVAGAPAAGVPATSDPSTSSSTTTSTTTTTTTAPPPSPARARNAGAEAEVVPLTNADRTAAGLGTLSRNGCLDAAASGFAEQMARSGVLAHNSGAGAATTNCRANATWGDNVGMSTACDTALLEREWMASPSHRRNILTSAFTLVGVGAWTDEKGTCWVQVLFSS